MHGALVCVAPRAEVSGPTPGNMHTKGQNHPQNRGEENKRQLTPEETDLLQTAAAGAGRVVQISRSLCKMCLYPLGHTAVPAPCKDDGDRYPSVAHPKVLEYPRESPVAKGLGLVEEQTDGD